MMNQLGKYLAVTVALMASGCIVVTDDVADSYEECSFDSDCFSSDYCQPFSSSTQDTAICTQLCFDNRDCPTTASGFEGVCLPFTAFDDACVESCRDDFDCATGFRCEVERETGLDFLICVPR